MYGGQGLSDKNIGINKGTNTLAPSFQSISFKTKNKRDLVIGVFPRFTQFACFYFEFSLVLGDIFLALTSAIALLLV